MKSIDIEIITPERSVLKDSAEYVLLPAFCGPLAVLPGHAPFIGRITHGTIRIDGNGASRHINVAGGVFEVVPEKVTIVVDSAETQHTVA